MLYITIYYYVIYYYIYITHPKNSHEKNTEPLQLTQPVEPRNHEVAPVATPLRRVAVGSRVGRVLDGDYSQDSGDLQGRQRVYSPTDAEFQWCLMGKMNENEDQSW